MNAQPARANCGLRIADCGLNGERHSPRLFSGEPQATVYELQIVDFGLQIERRKTKAIAI
jgi:hypothetical protein